MKPTTKNDKVKKEQTRDGPMMRDDRGEMKDDEGCEERQKGHQDGHHQHTSKVLFFSFEQFDNGSKMKIGDNIMGNTCVKVEVKGIQEGCQERHWVCHEGHQDEVSLNLHLGEKG